ncbi:MAG TPA: ABC transporter ATP-binding protein [bacterium]|nr:ABC transporter ATP-binding protein [bacterium]HPR86960.1 ABC transporter ATP-binding protein [bacterium]
MPEPVIEIRGLHTRYGRQEVIKGIDLDIYPNETLVILGRSGCGKSTLLRHIIGLQRPDRGRILMKGVDMAAADEAAAGQVRKRIGVLFQGAALFNSMSVSENVALPLREHTRLEPSTIQIMTRLKLEMVGLSGFDQFMPAQLSGGMKKRAGLARALAMDPDILLCDEPSAGLDPIVAAGIDALIRKLQQAFRMTIVVVTHELESVWLIADRIALMHEGRFLFVGDQAAFKASTIPEVRQFLERQPDAGEPDGRKYLASLVGEAV